jgi:hypothetical protein
MIMARSTVGADQKQSFSHRRIRNDGRTVIAEAASYQFIAERGLPEQSVRL